MNNIVFYVYSISAMIEMVILECVIRQVDYDWLNNKDKEWVRWARRSTFLAGQGYLLVTIIRGWFLFWVPVWDDIGLLWAGILILGVNVISLNHRQPPLKQDGYRPNMIISPIRQLKIMLRRLSR